MSSEASVPPPNASTGEGQDQQPESTIPSSGIAPSEDAATQGSAPLPSATHASTASTGGKKTPTRRVTTPSRKKKNSGGGSAPPPIKHPPNLPTLGDDDGRPSPQPAATTQKAPPPPENSNSAPQVFEETIGKPSREAFNSFFYPPNRPPPQPLQQAEHQQPPKDASARLQTQRQQRQQQRPPPVQRQQLQQQQPAVRAPATPRPASITMGGASQNQALSPMSVDALSPVRTTSNEVAPDPSGATSPHQVEFDDHFRQQAADDLQFVSDFWQIYDDLLFLSLFTQLGVVARLASSTWFTYFDTVFTTDSALFTNLPLNCLSCFILGGLCSGESCMEIISTRFSPPRLQHNYHKEKLADTSAQEQEELLDENGDVEDYEMVDEHHHSMVSPSPSYGAATPTPSPARPSPATHHQRSQSAGSADSEDFTFASSSRGGPRRRRRSKYDKHQNHGGGRRFFRSWNPPVHLNEELRDVQLLALERRIRQSKCLILFPVKKEDVDVMEHYFDEGYKRSRSDLAASDGQEVFHDEGEGSFMHEGEHDDDYLDEETGITADGHDLQFEENLDPSEVHQPSFPLHYQQAQSTLSRLESNRASGDDPLRSTEVTGTVSRQPVERAQSNESNPHNSDPAHVELHGSQNQIDINQIVNEVSANVTENVTRLQRVNIANGWDVGTTAEDMSDDLMLGLRFGFCGALSSFSSWNSAMINLILSGKIGEAFVGYMLGLQLPIIAYRFGQHIAVYIFVWRCRQETKSDERRGYGIRLNTQEDDDDEDDNREMNSIDHRSIQMSPLPAEESGIPVPDESPRTATSENVRNIDPVERQSPSIRAITTVVFIMAVVTQCTSISFYNEPQNQVVALSLLFSPLGVLARWQLSRYNAWRPSFPIGTFICNILACALSGGLGRLMAGNPNEEERLVLVSLINGFGGTLSSVANFIVEILAGVDPVLFRFDGVVYALWSIFWAMLIGFLFNASADWADTTGGDS